MAPPTPARPSLSITLPPSFEFHYNDDGLPRTPTHEQEAQTPLNPPPPPRPQTFKVRRKRAAIPEFQQESEPMSDAIIPTIEMSEAEVSSPLSEPTPTMEGLLAPALPAFQRLVTPPKTPAPRAQYSFNSPVDTSNEWDLINDSRGQLSQAFERSGSVCSSFSDSSISSCGSSDFSAPNNCASPQSEATDPFLDDELKDDKIVLSPDMDSSPTAKRAKTHRNVKWTTPMDDHLWMTFMHYLGDPRVTPFKMLAGTAPPLGVCHRVATKARRTWSGRRTTGLDTLMADHREGSPDMLRPSNNAATQPRWPRSDSATRKRLRGLCKRRPSLPAHYQRLLNTRSPSPFASSSSAERTPHAAFANYEMKMSLITSTSASMQPEGPLAQLSSDVPTPARPQTARTKSDRDRPSRPADWFARIPRSQAHQKSLSLQSGLNLNAESMVGTLASPFDESNSRVHLLQSMTQTKSLGRSAFDRNGPSLESPVELSGAPTASRTSLKRRFKPDDDRPKRPSLSDVFTSRTDVCIVRNRGFSVGAVRATDNLTKLFTPPAPVPAQAPTPARAPPPSSDDHVMDDADAFGLPDSSGLGPPGSRSAPRRLAEPVPRLGSPFTEYPGRQANTFPRSYLATANNPQPFQQRLRELAAHNAANQSQ